MTSALNSPRMMMHRRHSRMVQTGRRRRHSRKSLSQSAVLMVSGTGSGARREEGLRIERTRKMIG